MLPGDFTVSEGHGHPLVIYSAPSFDQVLQFSALLLPLAIALGGVTSYDVGFWLDFVVWLLDFNLDKSTIGHNNGKGVQCFKLTLK